MNRAVKGVFGQSGVNAVYGQGKGKNGFGDNGALWFNVFGTRNYFWLLIFFKQHPEPTSHAKNGGFDFCFNIHFEVKMNGNLVWCCGSVVVWCCVAELMDKYNLFCLSKKKEGGWHHVT